MDQDERIYAIADDIFQTVPVIYRRILRPDPSGMKSPFSPTIAVLVMVRKHGPISMSTVAEALSYSKQNLTKIVDQLVREGYVERLPDPSDRRVLKICLTEHGKMFMAERREKMKNRLVHDLSDLSDEELEYLYETFERVKIILPKLLPKDRQTL